MNINPYEKKIKQQRVLFIDDEPYFQTIYGNTLKKAGYQVTFAKNGQEALDVLEKQDFEILVVDLIMPIMSGLTFLKQIKNKIQKSKILCLTSLDSVTDQLAVKKLGVKYFFMKSDTGPAELVDIIQGL